ncbi:hypothetical protein [Actinoplanes sp. NPDC049265]|uniref:hypothetical protein n=1 Tax=Actinoplanes sp. NPDC049265 TaxID=3363902 RepID=UPI003722ECBE
MTTRRAALMTAVLLGLGACDASSPSVREPAPAPASTPPTAPASLLPPPASFAAPTGTPAPGGHEVKVGGRTIGGIAPGLDLPPGSKVSDSFVTGESTTVILAAPGPNAVLAHYRDKGPKAGYRVGGDAGGALALAGRGWQITVTTQARDSTLTFQPIPAGAPSDPVTPAY